MFDFENRRSDGGRLVLDPGTGLVVGQNGEK
jgi:hypothetical protein